MNVQIAGDDRAMMLKAIDLADKECDRVRDALDRLQVDDMAVQGMQGMLGELRVELKDAHRINYEWTFQQRRAAGIAMLFYKATINKRRDGDEKLLIDPRDIVRKLGEVTTLLEELSGQETLFTKSVTWADPKPREEEDDEEDDQLDLENPDVVEDAALASKFESAAGHLRKRAAKKRGAGKRGRTRKGVPDA